MATISRPKLFKAKYMLHLSDKDMAKIFGSTTNTIGDFMCYWHLKGMKPEDPEYKRLREASNRIEISIET